MPLLSAPVNATDSILFIHTASFVPIGTLRRLGFVDRCAEGNYDQGEAALFLEATVVTVRKRAPNYWREKRYFSGSSRAGGATMAAAPSWIIVLAPQVGSGSPVCGAGRDNSGDSRSSVPRFDIGRAGLR